jgi:ABC-type proline/glycine betaine transport system substrate-binding protein
MLHGRLRKIAALLATALLKLALALARYSRSGDSAHEIAVTTAIVGWPPAVAHEFITRGVTPAHAAKLFRDGLERVQ